MVQAQDEAATVGGLADLSALTGELEQALAPRTETQKGPKRPGRKAKAASDEREMAQFQNVLNFQAFQSDPLGALEQHLKNSIRLQKEKEEGQSKKSKLSVVKDTLKQKKRSSAGKNVKNKFTKTKKPRK
ncbi:unnamed protein product [Effrenium voratum]|nr:unnamed protein product [Effrenium voratum]